MYFLLFENGSELVLTQQKSIAISVCLSLMTCACKAFTKQFTLTLSTPSV